MIIKTMCPRFFLYTMRMVSVHHIHYDKPKCTRLGLGDFKFGFIGFLLRNFQNNWGNF